MMGFVRESFHGTIHRLRLYILIIYRTNRCNLERKDIFLKSLTLLHYRDPAFLKVTFDVLAVRSERHKYVENNHDPEWTQLFDLKNDPYENDNLVSDPRHAGLLAEMKARLEQLKAEVDCAPPPAGAIVK